jgi:hypothetical protein
MRKRLSDSISSLGGISFETEVRLSRKQSRKNLPDSNGDGWLVSAPSDPTFEKAAGGRNV